MNEITEPDLIRHYRELVDELTIADENREYDLSPEWLRSHKWKVVPVEDGNHFTPNDICQIVSTLKRYGYSECIAVATEPIAPLPSCYRLSVTEEEFRRFNSECGLFRFLLTTEDQSWAISCTEWYDLFAAEPELLEALLGKPLEEARQDYLKFASELAKSPDEPLLLVSSHYAAF